MSTRYLCITELLWRDWEHTEEFGMSQEDDEQENERKLVEIMQVVTELEEEERRMLRKLLGMQEE